MIRYSLYSLIIVLIAIDLLFIVFGFTSGNFANHILSLQSLLYLTSVALLGAGLYQLIRNDRFGQHLILGGAIVSLIIGFASYYFPPILYYQVILPSLILTLLPSKMSSIKRIFLGISLIIASVSWWIVLLFGYFLYEQLIGIPLMHVSSKPFISACDELNGKDFTYQNVAKLNGYMYGYDSNKRWMALTIEENNFDNLVKTLKERESTNSTPRFEIQNNQSNDGPKIKCIINLDSQNKVSSSTEDYFTLD